MVWDGLIAMLFILLMVAGWNVGIINSWRGPIAVVIATVATQQFYVDFATWIVQQLRVSPSYGIVIGYVLMWGAIEIACELILGVILPFNKKTRPMIAGRAFGLLLGAIKGCLVVLLPAIALQGPIKVPQPPSDKSNFTNPIESGTDQSNALPVLDGLAKGLAPAWGGFVISQKDPSFKPDFTGTNAIEEEQKKEDAAKKQSQ